MATHDALRRSLRFKLKLIMSENKILVETIEEHVKKAEAIYRDTEALEKIPNKVFKRAMARLETAYSACIKLILMASNLFESDKDQCQANSQTSGSVSQGAEYSSSADSVRSVRKDTLQRLAALERKFNKYIARRNQQCEAVEDGRRTGKTLELDTVPQSSNGRGLYRMLTAIERPDVYCSADPVTELRRFLLGLECPAEDGYRDPRIILSNERKKFPTEQPAPSTPPLPPGRSVALRLTTGEAVSGDHHHHHHHHREEEHDAASGGDPTETGANDNGYHNSECDRSQSRPKRGGSRGWESGGRRALRTEPTHVVVEEHAEDGDGSRSGEGFEEEEEVEDLASVTLNKATMTVKASAATTRHGAPVGSYDHDTQTSGSRREHTVEPGGESRCSFSSPTSPSRRTKVAKKRSKRRPSPDLELSPPSATPCTITASRHALSPMEAVRRIILSSPNRPSTQQIGQTSRGTSPHATQDARCASQLDNPPGAIFLKQIDADTYRRYVSSPSCTVEGDTGTRTQHHRLLQEHSGSSPEKPNILGSSRRSPCAPRSAQNDVAQRLLELAVNDEGYHLNEECPQNAWPKSSSNGNFDRDEEQMEADKTSVQHILERISSMERFLEQEISTERGLLCQCIEQFQRILRTNAQDDPILSPVHEYNTAVDMGVRCKETRQTKRSEGAARWQEAKASYSSGNRIQSTKADFIDSATGPMSPEALVERRHREDDTGCLNQSPSQFMRNEKVPPGCGEDFKEFHHFGRGVRGKNLIAGASPFLDQGIVIEPSNKSPTCKTRQGEYLVNSTACSGARNFEAGQFFLIEKDRRQLPQRDSRAQQEIHLEIQDPKSEGTVKFLEESTEVTQSSDGYEKKHDVSSPRPLRASVPSPESPKAEGEYLYEVSKQQNWSRCEPSKEVMLHMMMDRVSAQLLAASTLFSTNPIPDNSLARRAKNNACSPKANTVKMAVSHSEEQKNNDDSARHGGSVTQGKVDTGKGDCQSVHLVDLDSPVNEVKTEETAKNDQIEIILPCATTVPPNLSNGEVDIMTAPQAAGMSSPQGVFSYQPVSSVAAENQGRPRALNQTTCSMWQSRSPLHQQCRHPSSLIDCPPVDLIAQDLSPQQKPLRPTPVRPIAPCADTQMESSSRPEEDHSRHQSVLRHFYEISELESSRQLEEPLIKVLQPRTWREDDLKETGLSETLHHQSERYAAQTGSDQHYHQSKVATARPPDGKAPHAVYPTTKSSKAPWMDGWQEVFTMPNCAPLILHPSHPSHPPQNVTAQPEDTPCTAPCLTLQETSERPSTGQIGGQYVSQTGQGAAVNDALPQFESQRMRQQQCEAGLHPELHHIHNNQQQQCSQQAPFETFVLRPARPLFEAGPNTHMAVPTSCPTITWATFASGQPWGTSDAQISSGLIALTPPVSGICNGGGGSGCGYGGGCGGGGSGSCSGGGGGGGVWESSRPVAAAATTTTPAPPQHAVAGRPRRGTRSRSRTQQQPQVFVSCSDSLEGSSTGLVEVAETDTKRPKSNAAADGSQPKSKGARSQKAVSTKRSLSQGHHNKSQTSENRTVYITNLPAHLEEMSLLNVLNEHGYVSKIYFIKHRSTGTFQGTAYVKFREAKEAESAVEALNRLMLDGHQIMASILIKKEVKA